MKKIFTKFKKMTLGLFATVLFTGSINATTYTATQSGNWSSAITWGGGGSPGATIGTIDNVVIPVGMTVTLDMDVTVSSILSSINVGGSLTSTTNSLTITQGTLQGAGSLNLMYLGIGSLGTFSFSGTLTAKTFENSGATIAISSVVNISDTLILSSGSITFNAGSTLTMIVNSNIKVDAGSISVNTGFLTATGYYNVVYVGSSKTSGIETKISAGAANIWINMTDSSQVVTLGNDVYVIGTIYNTKGKLAIGANTLTIKGNYVATANAKITGSSTSKLMLNYTANTTSPFAFTAGSKFQYFTIDLGSSVTADLTGSFSVDTMDIKNGTANLANSSNLTMLNNGLLIWENGSLTLGANNFIGTNNYSVIYKGINKNAGFELTGSGLTNVMVDLNANTNLVTLSNNITVNGLLNLNMGSLSLNSHNLYLNGTFNSNTSGTFQGNASSSIKINNTTNALGDTINFNSSSSMLDSMVINTMASTWVVLGTSVTAGYVKLMSGSVMLTNGDLTINSTGSITGFDSTKYIGTSGSGSLVMNVNVASPYVLFPVGTNSSYSPASLQITSGTAGMFHVNTSNGMWSNGTSGTNLALSQSVVNRTWYVQEPTQAGALNANLQVEWKTSEEMNSFDRTHAFISHYTSSAWDVSTMGSAASVSGSFHQMTRTNITSFSPFALVDNAFTSGIEKTANNNSLLSIYPNPTTNFTTVDFKNTDAKSVEVYDEIGNRVYTAENSNKNLTHKLDLSSLPAGIYYVKVVTANEPIIKKLIKS